MTRRATERLATAVATGVGGVLIAVLAGQPEALLLVAPWLVLVAVGLGRGDGDGIEVDVQVVGERFLVGDEVPMAVDVTGAVGTVRVTPLPSAEFWPEETSDKQRRHSSRFGVLRHQAARVELSLEANQWGTHDIGQVEVELTEPFGLFRWRGFESSSRFIRVHPTQTQLRNLLAPWLVRRVAGAHLSTAVGRGIEYADIRPFASGDSLRDINWRATARSPEIWVSQRHPDRATDVVLLLDSFVESGHDIRTVFGLAVEGAVALAESHLAANDRVGLVELGGTVRWVSPGTGSHQLQRLSDFLLETGLHRHSADRDLSVLMTRALPPRSHIVALTPLLDDRFIEALLLIAGAGHDVAVVECESSAHAATADSDETTLVTAQLWQAQRHQIRNRLLDHGVAVSTWKQGDHLDLTLLELSGRRRHTVRGAYR